MNNLADERIRRPKKFNEVFDQLTGKSQNAIFKSYAQLMIFAASVGFYYKNKKPFTTSDEPIRIHIFNNQDYFHSVFNMISFLESNKDIQIFDSKNLNKRIKIFEEYAFGGLEIIKSEVLDPPGENYLENLLALITKVADNDSDDEVSPEEFVLEL